MEQRCEKFYIDSQKLQKQEILQLKKFLYKNQEYKFKENSKIKLFTSIETYVSGSKNNQEIQNLTFSLLEDALAMPFNVFSASQKQKLLKWYEQFQKQQNQQENYIKSQDEEYLEDVNDD